MSAQRDGDHATRAGRGRGLPAAPLAACLLSGFLLPAIAVARPAPGASSCSGCHGAEPSPGGPPPLQNLSPGEIEAALAAFRSGRRGGTIMPRIARGFSAREARAIALSLGRVDGETGGTTAP